MHFKVKRRLSKPYETVVLFGMVICVFMSALAVFMAGNSNDRIDEISEIITKDRRATIRLDTFVPFPMNYDALRITERLYDLERDYQQTLEDINLLDAKIDGLNTPNVPETEPEPEIYYDTGIFVSSGLTANQFNELMTSLSLYYEHDPENFIIHDMGNTLVQIEEIYNINGLYLIAICHRESGMNSSDNAIDHNNPTSISKANGDLVYYDSIERCLLDSARLLRETYHDQWGKTDIWDVGETYNPVNNTWSSKVHGTVEILIDMLNKK